MMKRICILLVFCMVAMAVSPFYLFVRMFDAFPFPSGWTEAGLALGCLLIFAAVLLVEYYLWRKCGLHLPPPPKVKAAHSYSLSPPDKDSNTAEDDARQKKELYAYWVVFPCYVAAVLCCCFVTDFARKDNYFYNAVSNGYFGTADVLLAMGADVDYPGLPAYLGLGKNIENAEAQLHYLLKNGADPNLKVFGSSAMIDVLHPSARHLLPLVLQYGGDLKTAVEDGRLGPVCMAAEEKNPDFMRYLLANGADANERALFNGNRTPLHVLVDSEPDSEEDAARALECIRILLQCGADVNAIRVSRKLAEGEVTHKTPLDEASEQHGFAEAIPLLIEHGAKRAAEINE